MSDLTTALRDILAVAQETKCPTCRGTQGEQDLTVPVNTWVPCASCGGIGLDPLAKLVVERLSAGISIVNTRTADHRRCVGTGGCEFTAFGHPSCGGTGRVPIDVSTLTPEQQEWAVYGLCFGTAADYALLIEFQEKMRTATDYRLPHGQRGLAALTAVLKERQEISHAAS